ncbi:hypothetical protein [Nocardia concava]|nr:hypothetical protein [Nocardia concava]
MRELLATPHRVVLYDAREVITELLEWRDGQPTSLLDTVAEAVGEWPNER